MYRVDASADDELRHRVAGAVRKRASGWVETSGRGSTSWAPVQPRPSSAKASTWPSLTTPRSCRSWCTDHARRGAGARTSSGSSARCRCSTSREAAPAPDRTRSSASTIRSCAQNTADYLFEFREGAVEDAGRTGHGAHRHRPERERLHLVWTNEDVHTNAVLRLSTRNGLIYTQDQEVRRKERRVCSLLGRCRLPHGGGRLGATRRHLQTIGPRHIRQLLGAVSDRAERGALRRQLRWGHHDPGRKLTPLDNDSATAPVRPR